MTLVILLHNVLVVVVVVRLTCVGGWKRTGSWAMKDPEATTEDETVFVCWVRHLGFT